MSTLIESTLTHYFLKENPTEFVMRFHWKDETDMYFLKSANFFDISRFGMKVAADDMKLF